MNRYDKVFVLAVIVLASSLFLLSRTFAQSISSDKAVAVVSYHDKEVLRIAMNEDGRYKVSGDLGDVVVEVKSGKVRVADEISPLHYCQTQGWVEHTNTPIVCLPNGIKIVLHNNSNSEADTQIR